MWFIPITLLIGTTLAALPLSRYLAWIMDGKYHVPKFPHWIESKLDTGPQNWKQYTASMLVLTGALFVFGFAVLWAQALPWLPFNSRHLGMIYPTTIFHTVISFMTNTDLQHYSGDQTFSNFTQTFFCITNFFLSAAMGFCALSAIIRAFRSDASVGNFFVDMWRVVMYTFLPATFILALVFLQQGAPMTYKAAYQATTLEAGSMGNDSNGQAKQQTIVLGPLAAFAPMKQLGTNGGGFFGMNSCHPYENPTDITNWLSTFAMMLFPFSLVFMYGRMLHRFKHSLVIFAVMFVMMAGTIVWAVYFDTMQPNPGLTAHAAQNYKILSPSAPGGSVAMAVPAVAGLPVDQHMGNMEGKDLRFGTSAGATFAAITVDVTDGGINCEHDSLNPLAAVSPMTGMWLNCIFGGKGVGMINFLLFLITGIFVAGQMVGRTPEYVGKKIGRREMTLVMIALLVHPILILGPTGLFTATSWGQKAESNPGAHGFSQILYQFSSASANNGSAFDGLGVTNGLNNNASASPTATQWDIATALVIIFSRYIPIIAPIALAASMGAKKSAPFGPGTLRDDTVTFGLLMVGTILIIGALLFLPIAALGPLAEHLGPIPFGG